MSALPPSPSQGPGGSAAGALAPPARRLWLHIVLFCLTLASTTLCGGLYFGWLPSPSLGERLTDPRLPIEGLKFSLPLMAVLLAHELGHLIAARHHHLEATLPYFLPMPIPFPYSPGTLGAVIRIRRPIVSRRQLLDVGAAGPLAGFAVLAPMLLVGLALSGVQEVASDAAQVYFGEPLVFRFLARGVFFPDLPDGWDIMLHPTAWAAWFGLFVTALNMLPLSQLDGGHVGYALLGRWHRLGVWGLWTGLIGLGFLWPGWWLWAAITAVLGPRHPPVFDEHVPLDSRRRVVGWLAFLVFAVSLAPVPIEIVLP